MHTSMILILGLVAGSAQGLRPPPVFSPTVDWSTVDGGGGEVSSGGSLSLRGTIGQSDAQRYAGGGSYSVTGGFWPRGTVTAPCPSDLNDDGMSDLEDFFLFLNAFDQTDYAGDFTQDGVMDLADFFGFLNAFDAGC